MGAWGTGLYENDGGMDFVYELADSGDSELLHTTLSAVNAVGDDYLEAEIAEPALIAADVVATLLGAAGAEVPEDLAPWYEANQGPPDPALVEAAKSAVARILAPASELLELWEESDDFAAWKTEIEGLTLRLAGSPAAKP